MNNYLNNCLIYNLLYYLIQLYFIDYRLFYFNFKYILTWGNDI